VGLCISQGMISCLGGSLGCACGFELCLFGGLWHGGLCCLVLCLFCVRFWVLGCVVLV